MNNEDKFDKKLDKIIDKLASVDVTLAEQHISLREHIRRTELLEHRMEPVEKHVLGMIGARKSLGIVAAAISLTVAVIKLFKLI